MLGALYLDQGFISVKGFILIHVYSTLPKILEQGLYVDPKSYLQEYTQAIWGITPTYTVMSEEGADHSKLYVIVASLGEHMLGQGSGSSKKK